MEIQQAIEIRRSIRAYGDRPVEREKLEAVLRRKLRRTGMLLSEPEVLRAMEHSALEKPCYLPIGKVTDGQPAALLPNLLVDTAEMGRMALNSWAAA